MKNDPTACNRFLFGGNGDCSSRLF